jgi:type IV pilus assembly protein PilA
MKTLLKPLRKKEGQKGFTLIELMIVVAIIGILAAIAIPQFAQFRIKSFNAAGSSDVKNLKTSLEAYYADNYNYLET